MRRTAALFLAVAGVAAVSVAALVAAGRPQAAAADGARIYADRCAMCHDAAESRAPQRDALRARPATAIVAALDTGVMAEIGKTMSAAEKQAVATFLSATPPTSTAPAAAPADPSVGRCTSAAPPIADLSKQPLWSGWGNDVANTRFQPAAAAGLTAADVPRLKLKWAFGFPNSTVAWSQPAVAAGRVFVGAQNGNVYALDAATGCTHWTYTAGGGVRTAISVGRITRNGAPAHAVFFGDIRGSAYAVDAMTGAELWKVKVEDHAAVTITGSPVFYNGRLYVPVSSGEEGPAARPTYPCCTFRGSVVAIDAATGRVIWKTFVISEEPTIVGKNAQGTSLWKPAGGAIWSAPTIDAAKNMLYVSTGNAYTEPAADTTDAIVAIDLESGKIQWANQVTPGDVYLIGCKPGMENCPKAVGPDHDFGNSPILRTLPGGKRVLAVGQKSGVMYALDPDNKGKILWQTRVGKGGELGGIEWGAAADEQNVYVPISDLLLKPPENPGGLFALRLSNGEKVWEGAREPLKCTPSAGPMTLGGGSGCSGAQSAAITVIPGVVFSGTIEGYLRAYSTKDGSILWSVDTAREYETVNGVKASGGSLNQAGPVVAGGLLLTNSGYGRFRGKPGNVLLAYSVD